MSLSYFAYGSNMSLARLRSRAPSARFVATAALDGHSLRFHKVSKDGSAKCDAYRTGDPADRVLGVIFEISPDDKPALDEAEGLGFGYDGQQVSVRCATHGYVSAFTYCATRIDAGLRPYHWYKEHVLRGCREHGLPATYVASVAAVESVDDPDPERARRELAIYR